MRVLVTGSAGFVGSAFARHYGKTADVVVCDIADGGQDCRDLFAVAPAACHFDLVIHCAAVVGGRATIDGEPLRLMTEDLSIDAALFRWALRARPGRIVYFSSSAMYGTHHQAQAGVLRLGGPIFAPLTNEPTGIRLNEHEHTGGAPDATYGTVKRVGEIMAQHANAAGIKTHVFRPFSGYGTNQTLAYPFPSFIRRAAQRETPFDVWGPGDSARDWIHIDDIVGAVLAAIDNDIIGPVNLCTGRATTFDQLAEMCMAREGYHAPIRHLDDAPKGVHWRVGDPTQMHKFYRPRITLEEGIARALEVVNQRAA